MDRQAQVAGMRPWKPPDGLWHSPPRPVSPTAGGRALLALVILLGAGAEIAGVAIWFVASQAGSALPLWLPFLVGGSLAAGAGLALLPLLSQRRLLAEGRAAPAVVTRHEKNQHGKITHYKFATLSGAVVGGHTGPDRNPHEVGATICVLYDPNNPGKNSRYPLSLVRLLCSPSERRSAKPHQRHEKVSPR